MSRSTATWRVGILAYTQRSREYGRRILRSLGFAPLVFIDLDELQAMGSGATELDLLYLGDPPLRAARGRAVLNEVRQVVGPHVPVLYAPFQPRKRPNKYLDSLVDATPAPWQTFSDLYRVTLTFLKHLGYRGTHLTLTWGAETFNPLRRSVHFENGRVRLSPLEFDIALEFFYNAGSTVSLQWLRRMLPPHGAAVSGTDRIASIVEGLRLQLRLDGSVGWNLQPVARTGYRLSRGDPVKDSSSPFGFHTVNPSSPSMQREVQKEVQRPRPFVREEAMSLQEFLSS